MVLEGSHANGLGAIFDGSLWMGSNARELSSPGLELKIVMISFFRESKPAGERK